MTFSGNDNVRTKLGVKLSAVTRDSGVLSPFVEANWVHNTETYGVTMSGTAVEQSGAEDLAEARLDADWRITENVSLWGHFGVGVGGDGYVERSGQLGMRMSF